MRRPDAIFATTPLSQLRKGDATPQSSLLSELPFCTKVSIRGDASSSEFSSVFTKLSLVLPVQPNTWSEHDGSKLFWMGPDEWLLHCSEEVSSVISRLQGMFSSVHASAVDISDYYTLIRVDSIHADEVLARSCPLDLHSVLAGEYRCAQTRVGNAACLLYRSNGKLNSPDSSKSASSKLPGSSSIDLQVRWSYAEYLWQLLIRGAQTIG